MNRFVSICAVIALSSVCFVACTDRRAGTRASTDPASGDGGPVDPRCWDPGSIVPDITCGSAMPDVVCPGSCAQTLDGIVGVGLSSCRCMDTGSGFGAQWICDTTACSDGPADSGVPDGGSSIVTPGSDGGAMCAPVTVPQPTMATCTTAQYYDVRAIATQADYDAFAANPANAECMGCLAQVALACGTENGCAASAGQAFCCLDDTCGSDSACRSAAISGACASQVSDLNRCVAAIPICGLIPESPPAVCFP